MKFTGTVIKYGDNVDTDVIIPARYLNTIDVNELASHCMEDIDKDFHKKIKAGDIMVAGLNFGCGLKEIGLTSDDIFIIGNEGHGIPREISAVCSGSVYIPISEGAESLNASVAAAVIMWEQNNV